MQLGESVEKLNEDTNRYLFYGGYSSKKKRKDGENEVPGLLFLSCKKIKRE